MLSEDRGHDRLSRESRILALCRSLPSGRRRPDPGDSVTIEASSDDEAIDPDKRRQDVIAYIDRVASGRREPVVEDVVFDDDRTDASS